MVEKSERDCYNRYLAISRSARNQPFQLRKDFENFEKSPEYVYLQKVMNFFKSYPQIKQDIYFKAPYAIYPDEQWFDLKFFSSQKAIHTYTVYFKQIQEQSPDSEENIQFIKDSLRYIGMFCIKNKIQLDDYVSYSTAVTKSWMKHVKEHNVSLYCLMAFPNLEVIINQTPTDEVDLLLGDIKAKIEIYRNRYKTSNQARKMVKNGMDKVKEFVKKNVG